MLKKFISYYRRHLGMFTLDMTCAFLLACINLLTPYIVGVLVDKAIPTMNTDLMVTWGIVIIALALIAPIFTFCISYFGHMMGTKIERDMRYDLFKHIQGMDNKFFTNKRTGELMSRIVGDLRDISEFAHHFPEDLFLSALMLIGSLIILFTISPILTGMIFVLLILILLFAGSRKRKMSKAFVSTRKTHAELNSQTENSLSGITVVKSYTNEKHELDRFWNSTLKYQKSWGEAYRQMGIFNSVVDLGLKLMFALTLTLGTYLAYKGHLTPGEVTTFVIYISFFTSPIRSLMFAVDLFQKGMSGFRRFYEMLQEKEDIVSGDVIFNGIENEIKFDSINFAYDEVEVLNNMSLTISKNESVALVGKTGVGKTTIAKLIPRFYDVTGGSITIDGKNIKEYSLESLRNNIGYVEQDSYIFYGTIKENIWYGNIEASEEEVVKAAKLASLDEFVSTLPNGYETVVGDRGVKLSGGQKQRVSLARMFLKNPSILVLDEATSALDNKTELIVQKSIEELSRERTSIIIAHRLTTIENCNTIYLLDENGICEKGNHFELLELKGKYYDMYTSAIKQGKTSIDE